METSAYAPMHGETYEEWWDRYEALSHQLKGRDDPRVSELMGIHVAIIEHLCKRYGVEPQKRPDGSLVDPYTFVVDPNGSVHATADAVTILDAIRVPTHEDLKAAVDTWVTGKDPATLLGLWNRMTLMADAIHDAAVKTNKPREGRN